MGTENKEPIDRMKILNEKLDEYESSIGLSKYKEDQGDSNDVHRYLNMSREQIEKLSIEDCAEAAILLGSLSFHIQRALNREQAVVNWSTNVLRDLISGRETQYKGSWESQFSQAVKEDGYANKVDKLKTYAKARADRLSYLASSIKSMSDLFVNMQRAKVMK